MTPDARVWARIDLGVVAGNLRAIRARIGPDPEILVVVKADAYGHGAVEIARTVTEAGATWLGVGDSTEALELREAGIDARILVLGALIPGEIEPVIRNGITPCVHSLQKVRLLSEMARAIDRPLPVHLKVDTGLGRLGVMPERVPDLLAAIGKDPRLEIEGIATHFAAGSPDDPGIARQIGRFDAVCAAARAAGFSFRYRHAAGSLGCLFHPKAAYELVRPGGGIYGLKPGLHTRAGVRLLPALSLHSQVVFLKDLPAGSAVGYGGTATTRRPTRIAILPIGYNDGYPTEMSNRASVLIRGRPAKVLGQVSMDYTTVDVTDIPDARVSDVATLIGSQGEGTVTAESLAGIAGGPVYAIPCALGKRVRRIYAAADREPAARVAP